MDYERDPDEWIASDAGAIAVFHDTHGSNKHASTVAAFGAEWTRFHAFSDEQIEAIGAEYFDVVETHMLDETSVALDLGCGSGRWSRYLARRCNFVEAVDPSESVVAATALTRDLSNVRVTQASLDQLPFPAGAFDFVLCLGVLHHVPDTEAALRSAVAQLRPGGWTLLYLYYALENRGRVYRTLFALSSLGRQVISRLPRGLRHAACDVVAAAIYLPLVWLARVVRTLFGEGAFQRMPLHYYHDKPWLVIRNDALDRFGTPLEQRFTRARIGEMMESAGLGDIRFSDAEPYWHAVGRKVRV